MSRPQSLSYDHDSQLFLSGSQKVSPEAVRDNIRKLSLQQDEHLTDDELDELIETTPVVYTVLRPLALPRFHEWLGDNSSRNLFDETADVMRDVLIRLRPDVSSVERGGLGFMGFAVERTTREYPHLFFQTLGNCACMSVDPHGFIGERYWDEQIASFSNHNVDTPEQEVSLLAGLGHIAHLASRDI